MSAPEPNGNILLIGYGSLLSGHGLLTLRRNGKSALRPLDAFPVILSNARRGLAKPSSHGDYLAMDIEPIDASSPIFGRAGLNHRASGDIGALGLVFDRADAEAVARREEYCPEKFLELLELADLAGQGIGEFLLGIARHVNFNLLKYRSELFGLLGYSSPGYIFHPVPLADGRIAIIAVGSGFEGTGDPATVSRRRECGMDRLLTLSEALAVSTLEIHRAGQVGYFIECLLGGIHGIWVGDLVAALGFERAPMLDIMSELAVQARTEREHFLDATSLTDSIYAERFGKLADSGIQSLTRLLDGWDEL